MVDSPISLGSFLCKLYRYFGHFLKFAWVTFGGFCPTYHQQLQFGSIIDGSDPCCEPPYAVSCAQHSSVPGKVPEDILLIGYIQLHVSAHQERKFWSLRMSRTSTFIGNEWPQYAVALATNGHLCKVSDTHVLPMEKRKN